MASEIRTKNWCPLEDNMNCWVSEGYSLYHSFTQVFPLFWQLPAYPYIFGTVVECTIAILDISVDIVSLYKPAKSVEYKILYLVCWLFVCVCLFMCVRQRDWCFGCGVCDRGFTRPPCVFGCVYVWVCVWMCVCVCVCVWANLTMIVSKWTSPSIRVGFILEGNILQFIHIRFTINAR
jgi:hypothetical protein